MADNELFDELKEEIEKEKLKLFFLRYKKKLLILGAVFITITGAYLWYHAHHYRNKLTQSELFFKASDMYEVKGAEVLTDYVESAQNPYRAFAQFLLVNDLIVQKKKQAKEAVLKDADLLEIIAVYNNIIESKNLLPSITQLALLKKAGLLFENGRLDQSIEVLEELVQAEGVYQYSAFEMLGLAYLNKNDIAQANLNFQKLAHNFSVPASLRQRAENILKNLPSAIQTLPENTKAENTKAENTKAENIKAESEKSEDKADHSLPETLQEKKQEDKS